MSREQRPPPGWQACGVGETSRHDQDPAQWAQSLVDGWSAQESALSALDDAVAADELAQAEMARVCWPDRVRAVDSIDIELPDGLVVAGQVVAVLADGLHMREGSCEWVIRSEAVQSIVGVGARTRAASIVDQRLTTFSVIRDWARERSPVQCLSVRGVREGTIVRVGADHLDLAEHDRGEPHEVRRVRMIAVSGLWAVRRW